MSYCLKAGESGKDHIIFVTKEDHGPPDMNTSIGEDQNGYEPDKADYGPKLPNGQLNWDCPCLGGMPYGPCGPEFRVLVKHYTEKTKCDECADDFLDCLGKYPELLPSKSKNNNDEGVIDDNDDEEEDSEEQNTKDSVPKKSL